MVDVRAQNGRMTARPSRKMLRGAVAGLVATVAMTAIIFVGQGLHLLHTPPPETVTRNVSRRVGIDLPRRRPVVGIAWAPAHGLYGAGCGALFAAIRSRLPSSRWLAGVLFGESVWAVSYLGYLPVADLYPDVDDDRRSRTLVMVLAHAVYGTALAHSYDRGMSRILD